MHAMLKRDPRVDTYIAKAPDYAKPILEKLRSLIHEADADLVEAIKWGAPTFVKDGLVCSFHAFKQHVALWFHKGALLVDPKRVLNVAATVSMRAAHFQEPSDVAAPAMRALVKQAVKLNAAGVKAPRRATADRAATKAKPRSAKAKLRPTKSKPRAPSTKPRAKSSRAKRAIAIRTDPTAAGSKRVPARKASGTKPRSSRPAARRPVRRA